MTPKYWLLLTFLLYFQTLVNVGYSISIYGIPICTILQLKFLFLNFREGRYLICHLRQPTADLILRKEYSSEQALSLTQMVELVQFTLDFKIVFNYKLNTMLYRKCQLILTLLISLFFLQVIGHWKDINTYSAMSLLANMKY